MNVHFRRMETRRISYQCHVSGKQKTQIPRAKKVRDLKTFNIKEEDIGIRDVLEKRIEDLKDISDEKARKIKHSNKLD